MIVLFQTGVTEDVEHIKDSIIADKQHAAYQGRR